MLPRGVLFVPAAAPAGRALAKLPPTYTVFPTTTCAQATPSIWTVGSASAVTVLALGCPIGAGSACAVDTPPRKMALTAPPATRLAVTIEDVLRRNRLKFMNPPRLIWRFRRRARQGPCSCAGSSSARGPGG